MFSLETIDNIKDIEKLKIEMLDNICTMFKGLSIMENDINIENAIKDNVNILYKIADKMGIDLKKEEEK